MSPTNWFERGWRLSRDSIAVVGLGGAMYVGFSIENKPTLSTLGPTVPWFVSNQDCERSSYRVDVSIYEWGGSEPGVIFCFIALDNGQIPYAVAPTLDEEKLRQARQEAEDRVRMGRREPSGLRPNREWFKGADANDPRVQHYTERRLEEFNVTPELQKRLHETRFATRWRAHERAFKEAAPWILAIWALIWIFTAITGRIVRDFIGTPTGRDERNDR